MIRLFSSTRRVGGGGGANGDHRARRAVRPAVPQQQPACGSTTTGLPCPVSDPELYRRDRPLPRAPATIAQYRSYWDVFRRYLVAPMSRHLPLENRRVTAGPAGPVASCRCTTIRPSAGLPTRSGSPVQRPSGGARGGPGGARPEARLRLGLAGAGLSCRRDLRLSQAAPAARPCPAGSDARLSCGRCDGASYRSSGPPGDRGPRAWPIARLSGCSTPTICNPPQCLARCRGAVGARRPLLRWLNPLTGRHRASAKAVVDGAADSGNIDCVSALLRRYEPELTEGLRAIGWTASAPVATDHWPRVELASDR